MQAPSASMSESPHEANNAAGRRNCDTPNAIYDNTDPGGMYRPNLQPTPSKGMKFRPLDVQHREPVFHDIPSSPIELSRNSYLIR